MKRRALLGTIGASMAGLAGCLGASEYTLSEPDVEQTDAPLRIDASLSGKDVTIDGPATLTLTLENTGEDPLQIRAMNLWPFGLPALRGTDDQEYSGQILLLSERYDEVDSVNVSVSGGYRSVNTRSDPVSQVLEPNDSVSQEYTIRGDAIMMDGTYELRRYGQGMIGPANRGQQGNVTAQQNNTTAQPDNETIQKRPEQDAARHLLEYRPQGGEEYHAYQPTVSVTVSTKSLIPDL